MANDHDDSVLVLKLKQTNCYFFVDPLTIEWSNEHNKIEFKVLS